MVQNKEEKLNYETVEEEIHSCTNSIHNIWKAYASQSLLPLPVDDIIHFLIMIQCVENESFNDSAQFKRGINCFHCPPTLVKNNNCNTSLFDCKLYHMYHCYGFTISKHVKLGTLVGSIAYFNMQCYQLATHKSPFIRNVSILPTELTAIPGRLTI